MNRSLVARLLAISVLAFPATQALAETANDPVIYRFDPSLAVADSPRPSISVDPQVVVEQNDQQTSVRLQTDGPVAPYLGAERKPELSPEELRFLSDQQGREALSDYRLEAGVGLFVEDKASLNLGYRFHEHPSLLGERRADPLSLSGDVRISFDLKFPFD